MKIEGIAAGLMALCFSASSMAGDIMVSWTSNGVLRAEGMQPGTSCTVEWSSVLQDGFSTNDAPFAGLMADSNGAVEVSIPMFFRMVGTPVVAPEGMVKIPGGTNSGTNPLGDGESNNQDYSETYSLTVDAFYMDTTEVTKAQWDTVYTWAIANGYSFSNAGSGKGTDHPVHTVNWYDCVKWCNARSEKGGKTPCYTVSISTYKTGESTPDCNFEADGYRLPTNAEWEYAARGGTSTRFPWGNNITHSEANYYSSISYSYDTSSTRGHHPDYDVSGPPYTSPAGAFAANGYGLYDMSGNVFERCGAASGSGRIRGGGWADPASSARCGDGFAGAPPGEDDFIGFRAVCR